MLQHQNHHPLSLPSPGLSEPMQTPAGASVFKLPHQNHQHLSPPSPGISHSHRRLQFKAKNPSTLSPPSPGLSDWYMHTPPAEGSVYGTKTVNTVIAFTRSIRSMLQTSPPESPLSSYGTKIITNVTAFTRSISSVFKLQFQNHHYCHSFIHSFIHLFLIALLAESPKL